MAASHSGLKIFMQNETLVPKARRDFDVDDFVSKLAKANCVSLPTRVDHLTGWRNPQLECEIKYKEMFQAGYKIVLSLLESRIVKLS